jgi:hypothetical protein
VKQFLGHDIPPFNHVSCTSWQSALHRNFVIMPPRFPPPSPVRVFVVARGTHKFTTLVSGHPTPAPSPPLSLLYEFANADLPRSRT